MTLSSYQLKILPEAIKGYAFPCEYYDYINDRPSLQPNMISVEELIKNDLLSGNLELVKNGLSNVLHWVLSAR